MSKLVVQDLTDLRAMNVMEFGRGLTPFIAGLLSTFVVREPKSAGNGR